MSDLEYTKMKIAEIEQICEERFAVAVRVDSIILDEVTTGKNSYTTVFKTTDNDIYALCMSEGSLTLADIQHIIKSMNMDAGIYLPPRADANYFSRLGFKIFQKVYPGRTSWNEQEERFYQTQAAYSPALVKIAKINGDIRRYNTFGLQWQKVFDFSYAKMKVQ